MFINYNISAHYKMFIYALQHDHTQHTELTELFAYFRTVNKVNLTKTDE